MSSNAGMLAREPTQSSLRRDQVLEARAYPPHIAGKPIKASTYQKHGCRCRGCTAANTKAARQYRDRQLGDDRRRHHVPKPLAAVRSQERKNRDSAARTRAATAIIQAHPDEYAALVAEARRQIAVERGPLPGDPT